MSVPSDRLPASLLMDALACLRQMTDTQPEGARKQLAPLHDRHPGVPMRLVWRREPADGTYHYDLLIRMADGTVSLALSPDRALPWPLRGSQHSGDDIIMRINGVDTSMSQAISILDVLWDDVRLAERLVNARLVEEEVHSGTVGLTDAELQEAMDAFRRAKGLLTERATLEWMDRHGLTHAGLEDLVAGQAAAARLRRRIVAGRAEEVFAARRDDFDLLYILRLRYPGAEAAAIAAGLLRADDPFPAATREVLGGGATLQVEGVRRKTLPAEGAREGDVLGPFPSDGGFASARVLHVRPAVLDEAVRRTIEERLFDDWLAERRAEATVEWQWGTVARTEALNATLREVRPELAGG
ncbi:TIGR04500 family putative peptide maturation system protein [Streptosporangium sp. NPDC000396]|uniref:TIGR04500 family putative peptide maturation system protein n=1 Tax=Streptosporangium sp. NPDC000396 TaxID=3366185 RepID=UPI0036C51C79